MTVLYVPFSLVVLDIIAIFAVIGVGYYATKMFYHMRRGRLERGWLPMIFGAILVAAGYVFLTLEDFFLAYSFFYQTLDYLGTAICSVGLIVIMLGLRSHYKAWSLKKQSPYRVRDAERKPPLDDADLR
ncbi:MAG: hypothetical protein OK457_07680 [Thaumarchaeota archaeon]|nr:hypothetical protein [Nitrososphaerota archaeon]